MSATDLTYGYEHTADSAKVRVNSASSGVPYSQSANASMTDDALYAGLQTTLWHRLTVTGQVRQDWVAGHAPNHLAAGRQRGCPRRSHTHFKAAYGTAFRAPTLFDRYGVDSYGYVGNPNLLPERAQGWEAGFSTTLPAFARSDFVTVAATYFNEQIRNLITTVFTPQYTAANVGSAHIQGVELGLSLRPADWLTMQASYTFTDAQNADTGSRLLRRPQNSGAFTLTATPMPGLTIVPELVFTGAFRDYLFNNAGFSTGTGTSGHGLIANLTVTYYSDSARHALSRRAQHLLLAVRAGERLPDPRPQRARRGAAAPVAPVVPAVPARPAQGQDRCMIFWPSTGDWGRLRGYTLAREAAATNNPPGTGP